MTPRKSRSTSSGDPSVLRNYSVPLDQLDSDQVLTGGRWWWSFLALVCLTGGILLARLGPNRALQGVGGSLLSVAFLYHFFIKKSAHYFKFGSSRLVFQRVPYVLGELFEAQLVPGRSLGAYDRMQFTLRCIKLTSEHHVLYADRFE